MPIFSVIYDAELPQKMLVDVGQEVEDINSHILDISTAKILYEVFFLDGTTQQNEERMELQSHHFKNIMKLASEGKVIISLRYAW